MTLLEFCRSFFPEEIFVEHGETITVNTKRLFKLEQAGVGSCQIRRVQILPSDILEFLRPGRWQDHDPCPAAVGGACYGTEQIVLSGKNARIMRSFHLVIDPEVAGIELDAKRPYFRMRGRPVTEEQAFDILRRTDIHRVWELRDIELKDKVSASSILDNAWFGGAWCRGWVWPNGLVGMNGHSGIKYPCESQLVYSILPLKLAFPYLDLMIGITNWNEAPEYAWDAYYGSEDDDADDRDRDVFQREDYPDFEENIIYGIWIHDDTMELMAPERAREKYTRYNALYAGPDESIYKEYYYCHKEIPVDLAYLKRCIQSHGLDPEEVLADYVWDPVNGLRKRRGVPSPDA